MGVISVLLRRGSREESSASHVKNGKHAWTTFLFENYEPTFGQTNEVSTDGSGKVYREWLYAISYVWAHTLRWHRLPAQMDPKSHTRVNIQDVSWTGSILNFSLCTPIWLHWFLQQCLGCWRYLLMLRWWLILRRNATMVCGVSPYIFGSCIYLHNTKIQYSCTL
jgi:hypothetical protein